MHVHGLPCSVVYPTLASTCMPHKLHLFLIEKKNHSHTHTYTPPLHVV